MDMFEYSDQDRLLKHKQKIDGASEELIALNEYDALGQLVVKLVGGAGTNGLQKINYTYNIRGWLKAINNTNNLDDDLFAFAIKYNDAEEAEKLYNGNISETYWKTANDNILRSYQYTYDHLNRLTKATYKWPNIAHADSFMESVRYDKNGNITKLRRYGDSDDVSYAFVIDDLQYTYDTTNKNRLLKVTDYSSVPQGFKDDSNGISDPEDDYKYDSNGNLVADQNKDIENITYNYLNLPVTIKFATTGNKISYLYNAAGTKIRKIVSTNSEIITDYMAGGFQYLETKLNYFPHPEGYVTIVDDKFRYVYNYTDHLGNIRLSYSDADANGTIDSNEIMEENNYYPFGLKHEGYNSDVVLLSDYKYNGQEFQDELGLNWYNYRHRNYDPAIGRFMGIDPISEQYFTLTNYQFAHNNPVWKIEIEGLEGEATTNRDVINNEPVYFSREIILNTVSINSQKEKHSRPGVATIRYGIEYSGRNFSASSGDENFGAEGSATPVQLSFGMAYSIDGERVEYSATIGQFDGQVNALGESVASDQFTIINTSGSYNLRNGENQYSIDVLTNETNTIFGSGEEKNKTDDMIGRLSLIGAFIETNFTELGNNLQDFGNLLSSWLEATVRENFDPDNSRANPLVD
jgi:RHS repeat-associated protein